MKNLKFSLIVLFLSVSWVAFAQLKIHSGGRISLGSTSTPINNFKLQVVGNSVFTSSTGTTTSSAFIRGLNSNSSATTPDYTYWGDDQTGIFHPASEAIGFTTNGLEKMRITSGGIKVTSSGNYAKSFWIYAATSNVCGYHMNYGSSDNFYVHAAGWIYSQGQYLGSDISFKKNIQTIAGALEKVKNLRGVTYQYNYTDSMAVFNTGETYMGLIAQEVEGIVPEVIKRMENGKLSVAYSNLVGLLIEAIKEQQVQIENLKSSMDNIRDGSDTTGYLKSGIKNSDNENSTGKHTQNVLYQNAPNPFKQSTAIRYSVIENAGAANIYIFDMLGTLLKSHDLPQRGEGTLNINGGEMKPGMYIYTLVVDGREIATKRMILTD